MPTSILNRDFQHPTDGWYQIEALGEHPHAVTGVLEVIDAAAAHAIAERFNAAAAAGELHHGHELLIDHEHFSDQLDQETRAYGWLQELQAREDGLYGRIRWTSTGKTAVDGGDYRFFSTAYEPQDLVAVDVSPRVTNSATSNSVRPTRLAGLTLTNMPNNRGQKPITNRAGSLPGQPLCAAPGGAATVTATTTTTRTKHRNMNEIAKLLGLAEDASESAVSAEITKLKNRIVALEGDQVSALLAERRITGDKLLNRLTPLLTGCINREDRIALLDDLGFKVPAPAAAPTPAPVAPAARVLNRGAVPQTAVELNEDEQAVAEKIRNRAAELQAKGIKFDAAWRQAQREINTRKS